jgi:hypothetical protein
VAEALHIATVKRVLRMLHLEQLQRALKEPHASVLLVAAQDVDMRYRAMLYEFALEEEKSDD